MSVILEIFTSRLDGRLAIRFPNNLESTEPPQKTPRLQQWPVCSAA